VYVLIVMQPEPGHTLPTIPIATALLKEGYRVVYLTSNGLAQYLQSRGFETETFGVEPQQEKEQSLNTGYSVVQSGRSYWRAFERGRMRAFLRNRISQVARKYSAALILVDHLFYRNYKLLASGKLDDFLVLHVATSLPRFDEPPIHGAAKRWVLCPAAFELPCFLEQDVNALYGEPSIDWDRPEFPFSMTKRRQGTPLILYSAGTQIMMHVNADGRLREILAAAEQLSDCDFVIAYSCGQTDRAAGVPDNVMMAPHIPQLQMLKQTAALISHCGLGSLKEAFCCGVPVLGMPMVFDQPYNAMRVRKQQLGIALYPPAVSAHGIRDGILNILGNQTMSTAVQALRAQFLAKEIERPFLTTLLQLLASRKQGWKYG
jgi:UDP:flavonoid glycosyltransferase YjiC (YdhE family)